MVSEQVKLAFLSAGLYPSCMRLRHIVFLFLVLATLATGLNIYWLFDGMGEAKGYVSLLWNNPPPQLIERTPKTIVTSWAEQNGLNSAAAANPTVLKLVLKYLPLKGPHILCSGWNIIADVTFSPAMTVQSHIFYAEAVCFGH